MDKWHKTTVGYTCSSKIIRSFPYFKTPVTPEYDKKEMRALRPNL